MNITTDLASWAAILGIVLPMLVALLQRDHWSSTVNGVIFGVACVVASVVYAYAKYGGNFTWVHWESALLPVIVWGVALYHTYYKPAGITSALRAIPPSVTVTTNKQAPPK